MCSSEHQNRNANTTDRAERSSTRLNVSQWKESEAEMVVYVQFASVQSSLPVKITR